MEEIITKHLEIKRRKEREKLVQKRYNKQICNEVIERMLKIQDVYTKVQL